MTGKQEDPGRETRKIRVHPDEFAGMFDAVIRDRLLTNAEVAAQLGVYERTITRWRKGDVFPMLPQLRRALAWMQDDTPEPPSLEKAA